MAVEIKYVVVRNGEEKMTFVSKKEADAYDRMLDLADELAAGCNVARSHWRSPSARSWRYSWRERRSSFKRCCAEARLRRSPR